MRLITNDLEAGELFSVKLFLKYDNRNFVTPCVSTGQTKNSACFDLNKLPPSCDGTKQAMFVASFPCQFSHGRGVGEVFQALSNCSLDAGRQKKCESRSFVWAAEEGQ